MPTVRLSLLCLLVLSTGSAAQTAHLVKDINTRPTPNPPSEPEYLVTDGIFVYFAAINGPVDVDAGGGGAAVTGRELYRTLGTDLSSGMFIRIGD